MQRSFILAASATTALALIAPAAHAAFPGSDGPILFGNGSGLFATSPDASPSLLFETERVADGLDVSPDGSRVLYNESDFSIWVSDLDGGNRQKLTPEGWSDFTAAWSPDGETIVFSTVEGAWDGEEWEIWTMDADGSDRAPLGDHHGTSPSFSPDGELVAYQTPLSVPRGRSGWTSIVVADADGGPAQPPRIDPLGPRFLAEGREPEWMPDGESIVFVSADVFHFGGPLHRVDVDSGDIVPVTDENGFDFRAPSVAPSGDRLVAEAEFTEPVRGVSNYGLATMDIDGSGLARIAGADNGSGPDWGTGALPAPQGNGDDDGDDDDGGSSSDPAPPAAVPPAPVLAAPVPAAPRATVVPSRRSCGSRRSFTVNVRGKQLAKVAVTVRGQSVKVTRKRNRFVARVDLRTLPKGRFAVKIRKTTVDGAVRNETRRYRTCTPKGR